MHPGRWPPGCACMLVQAAGLAGRASSSSCASTFSLGLGMVYHDGIRGAFQLPDAQLPAARGPARPAQDNILLDTHLHVKVADFGLSRVRARAQSRVASSRGGGCIAWLAPELVKGEPYNEKVGVGSPSGPGYPVCGWPKWTGQV